MAEPVVTAAGVALAIGTAHYAAHTFAGEEDAFDDAGVMAAGITVTVVSFLATWVVLGGSL